MLRIAITIIIKRFHIILGRDDYRKFFTTTHMNYLIQITTFNSIYSICPKYFCFNLSFSPNCICSVNTRLLLLYLLIIKHFRFYVFLLSSCIFNRFCFVITLSLLQFSWNSWIMSCSMSVIISWSRLYHIRVQKITSVNAVIPIPR